MWVLGGISADPASVLRTRYSNDVWYSSDGTTWHQATENASWSPRWGHSAFVFDNMMWVVGGNGVDNRGYSEKYNDVWFSSDGITWHRATENASWMPRSGHQSLVFGQRMWVLGGDSMNGPLNDIWYSYDGKTWYPSSLEASWSPRFGHQAIVFNNRMWILGGYEPLNVKDNSWIDYGNGKIYTSSSPHEILFNDVWNSDSIINSSVTKAEPVKIENTITPALTKSTPSSFLTILLSLILCIVIFKYKDQK